MTDFQAIYEEAHKAGIEAGQAFVPQAMIVGSPTTFLGTDLDPNKPQYFVSDGVCGFAWVHFKGTTPWARWAKKAGKARPGYPKGLGISCREFGQSMQKKEAYARAFAQVLAKHGIEAYADSRMD